MRKVLFAGSFDPFTIGHHSVFLRACDLFGAENVFIGVSKNPEKSVCSPERLKWTINPVSENVIIIPEKTLVADFCLQNGISHLIRSMRNTTDFNYEMELANWNGKFGVETVFIPCKEGYEKISSSSVRTIAQFGKDVSDYLPEITRDRWFTKPKRIIIAGFMGSGKSSYVDAFFCGKYNCVDMDAVAKECLDANLRDDIRDGIMNDRLDLAKLEIAGEILYERILEFPEHSVVEASALGTYAKYKSNLLRKLYSDSVVIRVDKFKSTKVRKIDEKFAQAVSRIQEKPLTTDFVVDYDSQSVEKIEKICAEAVALLRG